MTQDEVEKLEATRETDAMIAEKVMGWKNVHEHNFGNGGKQWVGDSPRGELDMLPKYTKDNSAALEVAETFDNFSIGRAWKLKDMDWKGYSAWLGLGPEAVTALAETIALAICRAALMLKTS
jgi:hypothetical protein